MYLSYLDIEQIAAAALEDFRYCTGIDAFCTPIDQFAKDYLGLNVLFTKLSADGSILGLTAYADTVLKAGDRGFGKNLTLKANDVVLDSSFIESAYNIQKLCDKRRFTLAHECAHQILFEMEPESVQKEHRQKYATRRAYSLRDLKCREDWNEWQANALGAALLMPADRVTMVFRRLTHGRVLTSYDGRFNPPDDLAMVHLTSMFGVSRSAMAIRLEQLGFLVKKPRIEYFDPTEVIA